MITVDALVNQYGLEISYLAGRRSGSRPLTWAHVIDLPDPWNWIGSGELILTTGGGIPPSSEQSKWMERVVVSGANGLIVAPAPGTPPLSVEALNVADTAAFPVLRASFDARFTEMAKEIINASLQRDGRRLAEAQRALSFYASASTRDASLEKRLESVMRGVGLEYEIRGSMGQPIARSTVVSLAPDDRIDLSRWTNPVPTTLSLTSIAELPIDATLQQSVVTIAAIEVQRHLTEVQRSNRVASVLLHHMIGGDLSLDDLRNALNWTDTPSNADLVIAAFDDQTVIHPDDPRCLAPELWSTSWASCTYRGSTVLLLPLDDAVLDIFLQVFPESRFGISEPLSAEVSAEEALGQALLALAHCSGSRRFVKVNEIRNDVAYLPSTREECLAIVTRLLGPLHAHDVANGSELLHTLRIYFEHDRSQGRTAAALFIHRHTLDHRLRLISRVTGMKTSSTRSIAALWIAFESAIRIDWAPLNRQPV